MILHLGRIALQRVEHAGISCHVTKKQGCVKGDVSQSLSGTSVWVSDQLFIKTRALICNTCNFTGVDLYCNIFFKTDLAPRESQDETSMGSIIGGVLAVLVIIAVIVVVVLVIR